MTRNFFHFHPHRILIAAAIGTAGFLPGCGGDEPTPPALVEKLRAEFAVESAAWRRGDMEEVEASQLRQSDMARAIRDRGEWERLVELNPEPLEQVKH